MPQLEVELLPVLTDNYVYLIHDPATGASGVVDPALAEPVLRRLKELGRGLDWALITHHHADHIGGLAELKAATGCRAIGPRADAARIPGLNVTVCRRRRGAVRQRSACWCSRPRATRAATSATGFPRARPCSAATRCSLWAAAGCSRAMPPPCGVPWAS